MTLRSILATLSCAALVYAVEPPQQCGLVEPKCGCFARSCSNAGAFAFDFDFLWWRSENHGFSFALNESSDGLFTAVDGGHNTGSIVRVQPNWDPGWRLGWGWNSDFDRWDLLASWTWYLNHAKVTNIRSDLPFGGVSSDGYYPQWPVANFIGFGPYRKAYGSWKMLFNTIDLELGRAYFATAALSFRPSSGVRVSWLNQKFISRFSEPLQVAIDAKQDFHGKNNWWGVGPRVGIESDWRMGLGLFLLGRASASLLYGKTSVWATSESVASGSTDYAPDRRFVDSFYALVPNLQLFLGLGWKQCMRCNTVSFGVDAGWEANYWWNQFNLPLLLRSFAVPLPTVGNQPVTMEGLTLNFHVDF